MVEYTLGIIRFIQVFYCSYVKSGSGGSLTGERAAESSGKLKSSAPKNEAVDLMDQLFCDPTSITTASSPPAGDSKPNSGTGEETEKLVGSKPAAKKDSAESGTSHSPKTDILDKESADSSSVKSETVVKEKASKVDSSTDIKAGSTNKPRKLPGWLSGITNTSSVSEKKPTTSRKRKSPAKTSSAAAPKKKKKTSEDGDSDTLPSPPPTKKVYTALCELVVQAERAAGRLRMSLYKLLTFVLNGVTYILARNSLFTPIGQPTCKVL